MSATTKKKKKHARKVEKRYEFRNFTSDIFEDEFSLPTLNNFPIGVLTALNKGNLDRLIDFLKETKVDEEDIEAIESLTGDELPNFVEAWSKASEVETPKS